MGELRATLIGSSAVVMWGALALFTTWTGAIPPFQLVAMTFAIAFLLMAGKWLWRREPIGVYLKQPMRVWIFGIAGLFGYHFFYFMALKNAPAVEASLIAYLWPLLIVVFSALLPGSERLGWHHLVGAGLGLAGCVLLVTDGGGVSFKYQYLIGYLAAGACALTWSSYSVGSRYFGEVPTDAVGWFCGATAIGGAICHLLFETWVQPTGIGMWTAILLLGLGPVGAAFFAWDIGMKRGNIRTLGALSYLAPLISALLLVVAGQARADWILAVACAAIVAGALLAAKDMIRRPHGGRPMEKGERNPV